MAPRRFAPKDVLRETFLTQLAVAPDGSSVVYGRRTIEGGEYRTRLWRVPMDGGRAEQITTGDMDMRPRFSPDGKTLVFISVRSGKAQPWLLPLGGGEPQPLAELDGQTGAAEWSPDGSRLALLAESGEDRFRVGDPEKPTARRIADLNWRLDGVGIRDQFTALWVVPARGGKPNRLTAAGHEAIQPFWSPDGGRIGYLADPRPEAGLLEQPQVWSIPAEGGRATKHAELKGEIGGAAFSPKGKLAYSASTIRPSAGATNMGLWVKEGSRTRRLGEELDRTFLFIVIGDLVDFGALAPVPVLWLDDDNVVVLVTDRGGCVPYRFGLDGSVERLVERDDAVCTWLASKAGASRRLRASTAARATSTRSRTATSAGFRATAARGSGPSAAIRSATRCSTRTDTRSTPGSFARGVDAARASSCNPRRPELRPRARAMARDGRARGRGLHGGLREPTRVGGVRGGLREGDRGQLGRGGRLRHMRLVDWALRQKLGPADHVGLLGLSYGGYMTNWLLGHHPGRFAAASARTPFSTSSRSTASPTTGSRSPSTWRHRRALGRLPADDREIPGALLHRNKAPLLLLQAEGDLRCPRARPRSRSRCFAASAAPSRWCVTRTSST